MDHPSALLSINDLSIVFGGLRAVDHVNFHINEGEFVGLIGPNGAGKTTFFNCITGYVKPTEGEVVFAGKSLNKVLPHRISHYGISRTFQNIRIFPRMNVLDNVCMPLHSEPDYSIFTALLGLPKVKTKRKELEAKAMELLTLLGLQEYKDQEAGTLPYGLQRRLEIARALAASPKLLLLDEPAAGMNNDECNELVTLLQDIQNRFQLTIILIEHHIDFVLKLCQRIYVLNLGQVLAEGTPSQIQSNPDVIRAYLGDRRRKK